MADPWNTYIERQQQPAPRQSPTSGNPLANIFGSLFSGGSTTGGIKPNKQGMYTPSIGEMPVGPPSPINYAAIRELLNSGVLKTGQINQPAPTPAPPPAPASAPQNENPLARIFSLFGGLGR